MTNSLKPMALLLASLAGIAACAGTGSAQDDFEADAARLVTALELQAGQTVADIGAGHGELAVALAREVGPSGRVYATELDRDRLADIRKATDTAGLENVSVLEAHATRTNLPDQCCDALVLRKVYHHFDQPELMNASLRQSLKPGGRLAILDFKPDGDESADPVDRDTGGHHGVTSETVVRELNQAGFETIEVKEGTGRAGFMVVVRRPLQ